MAIRSSANAVYSSFKKLDNCILVCIWSISCFSVLVLIGEFFLYKYLKTKPLQGELFLYFFSATLLFYFIIILAGFYILSKIYDYKGLESSISNSILETEVCLSQKGGLKKGTVQNELLTSNSCKTSSFKTAKQKNQRVKFVYPNQPQTSTSISSHSSNIEKHFKELSRSSLNTNKSNNKLSVGNYKENKNCEGTEMFTEQHPLFIFNKCLNEFEQRKETLHKKESIGKQNLFKACSEQHTIRKPNQKTQESVICNTIQRRQGTNVAEPNFALPLKNTTSSQVKDTKIPSNKRLNDRVIPKIVIEDVDGAVFKSSVEPIHFSRSERLHRSLPKNALDSSEVINMNATCSKCDTLRPTQMPYNTVGLPKPIKYINTTKSNRDILSCHVHSIKQQRNDSCNQRPTQQTQFMSHNRKFCGEENNKHVQQKEKRNPVYHINAQYMKPENILAAIDPDFLQLKTTNVQNTRKK